MCSDITSIFVVVYSFESFNVNEGYILRFTKICDVIKQNQSEVSQIQFLFL